MVWINSFISSSTNHNFLVSNNHVFSVVDKAQRRCWPTTTTPAWWSLLTWAKRNGGQPKSPLSRRSTRNTTQSHPTKSQERRWRSARQKISCKTNLPRGRQNACERRVGWAWREKQTIPNAKNPYFMQFQVTLWTYLVTREESSQWKNWQRAINKLIPTQIILEPLSNKTSAKKRNISKAKVVTPTSLSQIQISE